MNAVYMSLANSANVDSFHDNEIAPTITFTRGTGDGVVLTKRHDLNNDRTGVVTFSPPFPESGLLEVLEVRLDHLAEAVSDPSQFIILGKPIGAKPGDRYPLITKKRKAQGAEGIVREAAAFEFTNLLMLDIDLKDDHCIPAMPSVSPDDAITLIEQALGISLDNVSMFIKPSASANLVDDTGKPLKQSSGFHIYMALQGITPAQFHEWLHKRLVTSGRGHAYVSSSGRILIRTVFDASVGQPNHVDFFADPVLADGIYRECKDEYRPGGVLDLSDFDPRIDESTYQTEIRRLRALPEVLKLQEERAFLWTQSRAAQYEEAMSPEAAFAKAANLSRRIISGAAVDLYPDDDVSLVFDDGVTVNLMTLLGRAAEFNEMPLADPFDDDAERCKAKFYANQASSGKACIHSYRHGGVRYFLHARDERELHFPDDDHLPCFRSYDDACGFAGQLTNPPGLYEHKLVVRGNNVDRVDNWISDPLAVTAGTNDMQGGRHGLVLEFSDIDGRFHRWAMPREMVANGGDGLLRILADAGLCFNFDRRGRIPAYLAGEKPKTRIISVDSTGWMQLPNEGPVFVLPDRVIGSDKLIFQSPVFRLEGLPSVGGTLEDWQGSVAAQAVGNSILMISICVSLAGPLIRHLGAAESGGVHLQGPSSIGKSTCLAAAVSVWGGKDFLRQWRTTSNGLEATAAMLTDTSLILDEINEVDPKHLGESIYMLANGRGKARARTDSSVKAIKKWHLTYLSSGEQTPAEYMREGKARIQAGQEMRLLNIRVEREYGVFDILHGLPDGASLSDQIKTASGKHYGHAGITFIEKLITHLGGKDSPSLDQRLDELTRRVFDSRNSSDAQAGRAAKKFAVFALAGELATEWGIVPWAEGEATEAAICCFGLWRDDFGEGPSERRKILEAVRDFIEQHEHGRFMSIDIKELNQRTNGYSTVTHNCAGWIELDPDQGRVYLFNSQGMREATSGFSIRQVVRALDDAGWLCQKGPNDEATVVKRIGGTGTHRVYCVKPKLDFS